MGSGRAIIIDTREQNPLDFGDWPTMSGTLHAGDYSADGLTDFIAIERKSLPDLVQCIGRERDRFKRELVRMRGYKCKAVVIEATYAEIMQGKWRGKILPAHVTGSIASWGTRYGVEFVFAGNHALAAEWTKLRIKKFCDYCAEYAKRFII